MSRLERLVNLTAALLSAERPLTAEELRERVPGYPAEKASFRRQFERDKDALRELGLPLETTTNRADATRRDPLGAYRIRAEDYYLRDPGLAPDELAALHLAARVVTVEGIDEPDVALGKLGGADPDLDSAMLSAPVGGAVLQASELLAAVFAAIAGRQAIGFVYRDERRDVVPRRLSFRNGHWYLAAYDRGRGEERSFRIDRISSAVSVGSRVETVPPEARSDADLRRPWEIGDGPPQRALVAVDAPQAPWAAIHLGRDCLVEARPDGSMLFALQVVNVDAFRSFVIGFLDHAEVVGPPALRDDLINWLEALAAARGDD